jgi:hypothetical protein
MNIKSSLLVTLFMTISTAAFGQVVNDADGNFDSTSYVETDSTTNTTTNSTVNSTSTNTNNSTINSTNANTNVNTNTSTVNSTATNTNNNTNVNTNTNTNNNTNVNTSTVNSTSTNTNNNVLSGGTNNTNTNTNTNTNINTSTVNSTTDSTINQTINSTSNNTNTNTNTNTNANTNDTTVNSTATNTNNNNNNNDSNIKQEVITAPPSAIAPTVMTGGNDTCTVTFSAAVQTQILGASTGGHIRDLNCERLKNSKTLYNMGMKVAAVALMCQDKSVYKAMEMAGTPCPFNGTIGAEAQKLWEENPEMQPETIEQELRRNDKLEGAALGAGGILLLLLLL